MAFSPVAQCIATGSGDSSIKIWSLLDFTCLKVSFDKIWSIITENSEQFTICQMKG